MKNLEISIRPSPVFKTLVESLVARPPQSRGRTFRGARKVVDEGAQNAFAIHRKMTSDQGKNAKALLEKVGKDVTELPPTAVAEYRGRRGNTEVAH